MNLCNMFTKNKLFYMYLGVQCHNESTGEVMTQDLTQLFSELMSSINKSNSEVVHMI